MKKYIIVLVLCLRSVAASAQGEANVWYFGYNAGVDFNSVLPAALTNSQLNTWEGCASISDRNGSLLFYTDGQRVWDRNHTQMPNGSGLNGHPSATQSGVIVPKPGHPGLYYIFTVGSVPTGGPAARFSWSEVDMSLAGGLGDIVTATKNTLLFSSSMEKISAVRHANGLHFWIIGQDMNNGRYHAYPVNCNGVGQPVISDLGHTPSAHGLGYLRVSPDGKRLANTIWNQGYFLYDFDNVTGIVSNRVDLGLPGSVEGAYGICFSPDNNLLYGVSLRNGIMYQWNLLAGGSAAITASVTAVGLAGGTGLSYLGGAIQNGPDGKLYFIQYEQAYLGAIQNPDVVGAGCNVQQNVVDLQGRRGALGLPTFISGYPGLIRYTGHCAGEPVDFSVSGTTAYLDSLLWNFGDSASGSADTATAVSPSHRYNTPGSYRVRLIRYLDCITDTGYVTVEIDTVPRVDLGADTTTCGDTLLLRPALAHTGSSWLWSTGHTGQELAITQSGTYWLRLTENGCVGSDTIIVGLNTDIDVDLGPDLSVCDSDAPVRLHSQQPAGTQYLWSNGLSDTQMNVNRTGTYWLMVERNGCTGSDTVRITVVPTPSVYIGPDSIICEQFPLRIGTDIAGASYRWNTGDTTSHISVNGTNTYLLEVNLHGCIVYDTIQITAMPAPDIDLGADGDICPEQVITLDGTVDPHSIYQWNTGETTSSITVASAGTYWIHVTTQYHCTGADTLIFSHYPKPEVFLQKDTAVCEETPLMLMPQQMNADSLLWSGGVTGDALLIRSGGEYVVTAVNKCGTASDTIYVRQIFCDIWVPNAFTPNGDGVNDIFRVLGNIGRLEGFALGIYDRWGQRIFHTRDKYQGWDGNYGGVPVGLGTFVYVLEYSIGNKPYLQKGNFHLIR